MKRMTGIIQKSRVINGLIDLKREVEQLGREISIEVKYTDQQGVITVKIDDSPEAEKLLDQIADRMLNG